MTRGFIYMFRLRVGKAFAANPLAPFAFAFLVAAAGGKIGTRGTNGF